MIGLDIRSFEVDDDGTLRPGSKGVVEVNHPVLRSLKAGEIAEAARIRLAAELATESRSRRGASAQQEEAARRLAAVTAPQASRPTGYRPASDQLQKVAELFLEAMAAGGEAAKAPSLYVHNSLAAEGMDITLNTVRGQIHRARQKGLIPYARG